MAHAEASIDRIRSDGPVENSLHDVIQTLSIKLDSAARYGLYSEDAHADGYEDCAELFGQLRRLDLQAIADESSWAVLAEGTVGLDAGILRPGKLINVRGAGRLFSGSYLATRIGHTLTREGSYTQAFHARRNAVGMTGAELYVALP